MLATGATSLSNEEITAAQSVHQPDRSVAENAEPSMRFIQTGLLKHVIIIMRIDVRNFPPKYKPLALRNYRWPRMLHAASPENDSPAILMDWINEAWAARF